MTAKKKKSAPRKKKKTASRKYKGPAELIKRISNYAKREYGIDFKGTKTDKKRSEMLGKWALSSVIAYEFDDIILDEFDEGWVDGSGDKGIDFIELFDETTVVILQSKLNSPTIDSIRAAKGMIERVMNKGDIRNSHLKTKADAIDDHGNKNWHIYYVTNGKISADENSTNAGEHEAVIRGVDIKFNYSILDGDELLFRHNSVCKIYQPLKKPAELEIAGGLVKFNSPKETYLFAAKGTSIPKLLSSNGLKNLQPYFQKNYRFGKNTKINAGLHNTAIEEPENFFYYNNGISCLASDVKKKGSKLIVEQLQIVNGAQTTSNLVKDIPISKLKELRIPVKLTVVDSLQEPSPQESEFIQNVIEYNNTQNKIEKSDFLSNLPLHEDISQYVSSKQYRYDENIVKYYSKAQGLNPAESNRFYPLWFTKMFLAVYEFKHDPILVVKSKQKLWNRSGDIVPLANVFGRESDGITIKADVDDLLIGECLGTYWISQYISNKLKEDKAKHPKMKQGVQEHAFSRGSHLARAVYLCFYKTYKDPSERIREYANPCWLENEGSIPEFEDELDAFYQKSKAACISSIKLFSKRNKELPTRRWQTSSDSIDEIDTVLDAHIS